MIEITLNSKTRLIASLSLLKYFAFDAHSLISPDRILRHVNILTFGRVPAFGQQTILSQPDQESVRRFFEDLARYLTPSRPAIQPEDPFSNFACSFLALLTRLPHRLL
jgi:hypothetical protein